MQKGIDNKSKYFGIIPPLVTPLLEDESLDEGSFVKIINYCIDGGVHGVFTMGTSGEAMNVTRKVWGRAIEISVKEAGSRVPVFCGVIDSCTIRVIENIKEAQQVGAKIVVVAPAFYLQNTCQDEIIRHFEKVCNSTDLQVAIYNIPSMTHVNILPETISELAKIDNVVAYKDSCGNWEQVQRDLFLLEDSNISFFNGAEELCSASMIFGAQGCIPGLANYFPKLFVDLYNAGLDKDIKLSYELQKQVWDVRKSLSVGKSWISAMKYIGYKLSLSSDKASSPIEPLNNMERKRIDEILEKCLSNLKIV
ncbi:MAG: dihydrodipicolinate synthase family protein [Candidatus Humimicrobiaceae bacterium]